MVATKADHRSRVNQKILERVQERVKELEREMSQVKARLGTVEISAADAHTKIEGAIAKAEERHTDQELKNCETDAELIALRHVAEKALANSVRTTQHMDRFMEAVENPDIHKMLKLCAEWRKIKALQKENETAAKELGL